jgi:RNA polymerase sigma factor (TIGR02999 family)
MTDSRGEVTMLLNSPDISSPKVQGRLFQILYSELERLAAVQMRNERKDHTFSPNALVHEVWLRLTPVGAKFENRNHFLSVCARAMRRVLVDHARAHRAARRGGPQGIVHLDTGVDPPMPMPDDQLVALDEALSRLAEINPRAAEVIELRFFGGLTESEVASLLNLARRTVNRDWELARAWLFKEISGSNPR